MPTYQYACTECGDRLEVVQRFSDDPLTACDACGGKLRKVFSPVGIVFKGSGFYRTDSRNGSVPATSSGNGKAGADSGTSGSGKSADSGSGSGSGDTGGTGTKEGAAAAASGGSANGSSAASTSAASGSKVA